MPVRHFAIVGQKACASEDFLLDDFPGTSGRLDVLVRCLRAALLSSHGIRRDVVVYLVLRGGPLAPRIVKVDGATVTFLRPDERSLAVTMKKVLATRADEPRSSTPSAPSESAVSSESSTSSESPSSESPPSESEWVTVRPGFAVVRGDFERVLADVDDATPYVVEQGAGDIREVTDLAACSELFVIGDHLGLPDDVRSLLVARGARHVALGPVGVHADDAVTLVTNELDRRTSRR